MVVVSEMVCRLVRCTTKTKNKKKKLCFCFGGIVFQFDSVRQNIPLSICSCVRFFVFFLTIWPVANSFNSVNWLIVRAIQRITRKKKKNCTHTWTTKATVILPYFTLRFITIHKNRSKMKKIFQMNVTKIIR